MVSVPVFPFPVRGCKRFQGVYGICKKQGKGMREKVYGSCPPNGERMMEEGIFLPFKGRIKAGMRLGLRESKGDGRLSPFIS